MIMPYMVSTMDTINMKDTWYSLKNEWIKKYAVAVLWSGCISHEKIII